jgi:hypothetical protein
MLPQYKDSAQRKWTISKLQDIVRLTGWQTARAVAGACERSWVRTAEAERGPPYTRIEVEQMVRDIWSNPRKIDRTIYGPENEEKRLAIERPARVHYALGILDIQQDFEDLNLNDEENSDPDRAMHRLDSKKNPKVPKLERTPEVQGRQGSSTDESGANATDQYHQANPENSQGGMTNSVKQVVEQDNMLSWRYVLSNLASAAQAFWPRETKIPDGKIRVRWKCVSSVYKFNMIKQLLIGS